MDSNQTNTLRRSLVLGAGAAAVFAPLANAMNHGDGESHKHGNHQGGHGGEHAGHGSGNKGLKHAIHHCMGKGEACIAHCLVLFQSGDLSVADCAAKVHEMKAVCEAMYTLVVASSSHSAKLAPLCITLCTECQTECEKHPEHPECKACGEACEKLINALEQEYV